METLILALLGAIVVLLLVIYLKVSLIAKHFKPQPTKTVDWDQPDELFDDAAKILQDHDKASASLLQRRLSLGYARSAVILEQLEQAGLVGPAVGSKPRQVNKDKITEYLDSKSLH